MTTEEAIQIFLDRYVVATEHDEAKDTLLFITNHERHKGQVEGSHEILSIK